MTDSDPTPCTLELDPAQEPTRREQVAAFVECRLNIPMAVLALAWAGLVAYELVAPTEQRDELRLVGNVLWGIFLVEFLAKLAISGRPLRFLRRRWPAVLFLALPALRAVRVVASLRALRLLPAARVVGSSYRAIGTARTLLGGRLAFLAATTAAVIFAGGQLLFLSEGSHEGQLGETLWWSANLAISSTYVFEPQSILTRIVTLVLSGYAIVVFASLAAALGAFFVEHRAEQARKDEP